MECVGKQRRKNNEWGSQRWRCEKEEREDPNACEMKRIKGLHTSRRGRRMRWQTKKDRLKMGGGGGRATEEAAAATPEEAC